MTSTRPFARRSTLTAVCIGALVLAPRLLEAQGATTEVRQQSVSLSLRSVAQQLGAKLNPEQREELSLGVSLNGTLQDPQKLERLGIRGMQKGARVTAMRVAPQKLIVEVDQIDPTPLTRRATLRIDEQGRLSAP